MLIRIEKNLDVLTLRATLRYVHASYRRLAATQVRSGLNWAHMTFWTCPS